MYVDIRVAGMKYDVEHNSTSKYKGLIITLLIVSRRHVIFYCIYFYILFLISCLIFICVATFTDHRKFTEYRRLVLAYRIIG